MTCHRVILSSNWLVTDLICHRSNCHRSGLSPIWPVSYTKTIFCLSVGRYHCTTVEPRYFFSRYQYRGGHGTTVVPQYHEYRGTTVRYLPTNSDFREDLRAKNQSIHRMNKLEVFKLHVDDIRCNWWESYGAIAQLKESSTDWCSCSALCRVIM